MSRKRETKFLELDAGLQPQKIATLMKAEPIVNMHSSQMSISLNPTHEQFVLSKIENGKYANVDEVIAAAFQLLEEQEKQYAVWLEDTRKKVDIGLEEIKRGDVFDTEVVIKQLKDKLIQKRESQT